MNDLNQVLKAFKIDGVCTNVHEHRHMKFYDVRLTPGTPISKLEKFTREIALELRSITTPIIKSVPDKGVIRLQVATKQAEVLPLTALLKRTELIDPGTLPMILGETDEGRKLCVDFAKHPHTLIAGGTGSGKSILLHNIIANIANLNSTENKNIKVFLCDPKRVEFNAYKNKRFVTDIAYDYADTVKMLELISRQMESRYESLAKLNVSDSRGIFPSYVVIIDEVADLMQNKKERKVEELLVRLGQKSRAAGIYLIAATQRPSVDVLTGLIKANFPARISCKVATRIDSQVIMDSPGAENLLGYGDALYQSPLTDRIRFQVAYTEPNRRN